MKHYAILNNYQLGSGELRTTRVDKIVDSVRIDKYHTKVVWDSLTLDEQEHIVRALFGGKKWKLKEM